MPHASQPGAAPINRILIQEDTAVKITNGKNLIAAALIYALAFGTTAQAQQVPLPKTAAEVPGPASGTAMTKAYVQMMGRMAYLWGWPLVKMGNRSVAFSKLPAPGLIGGVLPAVVILRLR